MKIGRNFWHPIDIIGCHVVGKKFVGGESVEEVLKTGAQFKRLGCEVTYNLLGEHAEDLSVVSGALATTRHLVRSMDDTNKGNVSIKPTLYGLQISSELFLETAEKVIARAEDANVETEFDAEAYSFIPDTFKVFSFFASKPRYRHLVRQAVQVHLLNIFVLMDEYGLWDKKLRIVQGAGVYSESSDLVTKDSAEILLRYNHVVRRNRKEGRVPFAATVRNRKLAESVKKLVRSPDEIEFQMLYGLLGGGLRKKLLRDGWPVRIYIPFVASCCKDAWKEYGLRRSSMMRRLLWEEVKDKF